MKYIFPSVKFTNLLGGAKHTHQRVKFRMQRSLEAPKLTLLDMSLQREGERLQERMSPH